MPSICNGKRKRGGGGVWVWWWLTRARGLKKKKKKKKGILILVVQKEKERGYEKMACSKLHSMRIVRKKKVTLRHALQGKKCKPSRVLEKRGDGEP